MPPIDQFASAVCGHNPIYTAAIEKENFYDVEFRPERSGEEGEQIIQNFINLQMG